MDISALRARWDKLNAEDPEYLVRWIVRRIGSTESDAAENAGGLENYVEGVLQIVDSILDKDNDLHLSIAPLLGKFERRIESPNDHQPKAQASFVVSCFLAEQIFAECLPILGYDYTSPYLTSHDALTKLMGQQFSNEISQEVSSAKQNLQWSLPEQQGLVSPAPTPVVIEPEGHLSPENRGLVGNWVSTDFYSSGGFSAQSELHLLLGADGYFVRTARSAANLVHTDSSGNYLGQSAARSGVSPGDRGTWTVLYQTLVLNFDDDMEARYNIDRSGGAMLLNGKLYERTR